MTRIATTDLDALESRFASASPAEILAFAHHVFGARLALLSSMQRAGTMLCHLADRAALDLDVLFVDTGVLFPESLATRDRIIAAHPHLRIKTLTPLRTLADQTREEGVLYLTREGQERCCDLRKSEPLRAVRGAYDALVGALRRDEGGARAKVRVFDIDPDMNALRVHPLAHLSREQLDSYIAEHTDVVVNPLHAMGYPTIGCYSCTTPVRADEPERAGRWRHLAGVEYCGINPTDRGTTRAIELDDRYGLLLGLKTS